jgi:hypothetical protein
MLQLNVVFRCRLGVVDVIGLCADALRGGLLSIFSFEAFLLKLIIFELIMCYCIIWIHIRATKFK